MPSFDSIKLIVGVVLLATIVSLGFWVKSLRSDLAIADANTAIEKAGRLAAEQRVENIKAQIELSAKVIKDQADSHAKNEATALDLKGVTANAKPEGNVVPPVMLDILDKLRSTASGGDGNTVSPGGSAGSPDAVPAGAGNSKP